LKGILHRMPMLKILLPFSGGTLISIILSGGNIQLGLAMLSGISGFTLVLYLLNRNRILKKSGKYYSSVYYKFRWLNGFIIFLFAFGAGAINTWLHSINNRPDFFADAITQHEPLLIQITAPLQDKGDHYKTTAKFIATGMHQAEGKLLLYFQKDSTSQYPVYGDQVVIKNKVALIKNSEIPFAFDFRTYMSYQGIYHSAYLKNNEWAKTGINHGNPFWKSIYAMNLRLKKELRSALPDPDQRGIAEALIVGDESDIPNEIMTDYAGTGTVHILSVSGLHVGLILIGLSWIFSFLTRIPNGKFIRTILILSIIWAYAFLTGFSAPIARSVIMFSIVFIGLHLGRSANIYNSIAVAAFILLLIDPFLMMQASCQLSFISLTGIVWLQPKIVSIWEPKNSIVKYIWIMATASIAAQIITFPLSIYYFNQVSNYFLPANLIVIPASFIILLTGVAFVFTDWSSVQWLHQLFSLMLKYCIYALNNIAAYFNHLPGAAWNGLYINAYGLFLLLLFVVLSVSGLVYRNKQFLSGGLIIGVLFFLMRDLDIFHRISSRTMSVFVSGNRHTIVALKDQNQFYVITDSSFTNDKQLMKYNIAPYAYANYIRPENIICINPEINPKFSRTNLMIQGSLIGFYDKNVLMLNSKLHLKSLNTISNKNGNNVDVLVLSENAVTSLTELYHKFRFSSVKAASGNKVSNIRNWETVCIENNIPFTNLQNNNFTYIPL